MKWVGPLLLIAAAGAAYAVYKRLQDATEAPLTEWAEKRTAESEDEYIDTNLEKVKERFSDPNWKPRTGGDPPPPEWKRPESEKQLSWFERMILGV